MSVPIIAICDPPCGKVWITKLLIGIKPEGRITLEESRVSPCPACGGESRIPDGVYAHASASLFYSADWNAIASAIEGVDQKIREGVSAKEIVEEIQRHPILMYLSGFLPRNWKDMNDIAKFIGCIYLAVIFFRGCDESQKNQGIQMKEEVYDAIRAIVDKPDNQHDIQNERSPKSPQPDEPNKQ